MKGFQWETHNGCFSPVGEVVCVAAGAGAVAVVVSEVEGHEV